jgi:hypothetical protein
VDTVETGINGSKTGSGSATGAGAGNAFFFFVCFGLLGFPIIAAGMAPKQQHSKQAAQSHAKLFMKEPEEPDAFHPELSAEPDGSTEEESWFKESDTRESDESPLEPEEESHGVTVVVVGPGVTTTVMVVCALAMPNNEANTMASIAMVSSDANSGQGPNQ